MTPLRDLPVCSSNRNGHGEFECLEVEVERVPNDDSGVRGARNIVLVDGVRVDLIGNDSDEPVRLSEQD